MNVRDYWDPEMEQNKIVIKSYKKKLLFAQQFYACPYRKFHLVKTLQLCWILYFYKDSEVYEFVTLLMPMFPFEIIL